jgi:hypothetical protein
MVKDSIPEEQHQEKRDNEEAVLPLFASGVYVCLSTQQLNKML